MKTVFNTRIVFCELNVLGTVSSTSLHLSKKRTVKMVNFITIGVKIMEVPTTRFETILKMPKNTRFANQKCDYEK